MMLMLTALPSVSRPSVVVTPPAVKKVNFSDITTGTHNHVAAMEHSLILALVNIVTKLYPVKFPQPVLVVKSLVDL